MRYLPQELKNKLLQNIQTDSTNAKPNLRLIATQASCNTLISEDIHKSVPANFGDIAIRQLDGENTPSVAYAICIDNGIANIYRRDFPTDLEKPWVKQWSLGSTKEVAIEYNGEWCLDAKKKWHYLRTEEYPYVFYVDNSNNLFVQHWCDSTTKTQLTTGVSQISACRGWQSHDDVSLDQGLIISYIKSGKVYYRAFCNNIWETERDVTPLGIGNTSLCVFRTNDFRVGFITENNGQITYTLSKRTYAGQSVRPETAYVEVNKCEIKYTPIKYLYAYVQDETLVTDTPTSNCVIEYYKERPALEVISTKRIDNVGYEVICSFSLLDRGLKGLTITPKTEITDIIVNDNKLSFKTTDALSKNIAVEVTVPDSSGLFYKPPDTSYLSVSETTIRFSPEAIEADNETIISSLIIKIFSAKQVIYSDNTCVEDFSLRTNIECTLSAIKVGEQPV